jgi:cAMP-dependent protein kinase regulator
VDVLPATATSKAKGPRTSVSAEAFGMWNKKEDFEARVIEKPQETKDKITARLRQSFIFSALNEEEFNIVVNAMEEKRFHAGETIIHQGEDGNELFIVEQGTLSCFRLFSGQSEQTFLRKYEPGDAFGELALLYNAPRAATISADTDLLLWSLDRPTFNHIVKDSSRQKRERYEHFLQKVKVLETMSPYERTVLSDALQEEKCFAGDYIIKLGEEGNKFYIVEEGEVIATIIEE